MVVALIIMKNPSQAARFVALIWLFLAACDSRDVKTDSTVVERDTIHDTVVVNQTPAFDSTSFLDPSSLPVTLPVLDAFMQDSTFVAEMRDSLQLSAEQITELRRVAREQSALIDSDSASIDTSIAPGTTGARTFAMQRISAIIGPEKTYRLASLIRTGWEGTPPPGIAMGATPNMIPSDTRVVINAPSFRMDLFENGHLVKTYSIASGYPEFPLPTGLRQASEIIFNPSWTPPDEAWVAGSGKVKAGVRVAPGSNLNPLGIMKIPIGGPSLIHGGKSQGQIGGFGSHGCAGLTNEQAREFARLLAEASGAELTDKQIAGYGKNRTESKSVKLAKPVPVELRYETMVVMDGAMHIYPDVYDRGTNSEESLRAVLQANGVTLEQLSEVERTKLLSALAQMSGVSSSDSLKPSRDTAKTAASPSAKKTPMKMTRSIKGPKELVVPIAALKGKGYPKPVKVAKRAPVDTHRDTTV